MIDDLPTVYSYNGDGFTTMFAYPGSVGEPEDIKVSVYDSAGARTDLVYSRDYTVDPISSGGTTTAEVQLLIAAPPSGSTVKLWRDTPIDQEVNYSNQGPYSAVVTESSFDKLTRICQELAEAVGKVDPDAIADIEAELVQIENSLATKVDNNDPRLSNARTPTAHASSHGTTGTDKITPAMIGAVATGDPRLTDARTPTAHKTSHATGGTDAIVPSTIGAVAEGDSRLSDARTPKAHAASHAAGGSDAIALPVASAVQRGIVKGDETTIHVDNAGVASVIGGGGSGMPIAPSTGGPYGAKGSTWVDVSGGGGGTFEHDVLTAASRMKPNQHPQEAITDLVEDLANIINALTAKANLASPTFSGTPKAPTPASTDNSTNIATTAFVKGQNYAPKDGPVFSGSVVFGSGTISTNGTVTMTIQGPAFFTQSPTAPTPALGDNSTKVATTEYVQKNAAAPIVGEIRAVGFQSTISKWLQCAGQAVSRTTYSALFAAIGTYYGAGDGSTTFHLPDLRGRVPLGYGQGDGLTGHSIGAKGGAETHTLTTAELSAHDHEATDGFSFLTAKTTGAYCASGSARGATTTIKNTGGNQAHNNMQPWLAINFIIYAGV